MPVSTCIVDNCWGGQICVMKQVPHEARMNIHEASKTWYLLSFVIYFRFISSVCSNETLKHYWHNTHRVLEQRAILMNVSTRQDTIPSNTIYISTVENVYLYKISYIIGIHD